MSRQPISVVISGFIVFLFMLTASGVCEVNPQNRFSYTFSRNGNGLTVTINYVQESFDGLDAELYRPRTLELWPQWQNTCLQLVGIQLGQAAILADKTLTQSVRDTSENVEWSEARAVIMSSTNTNRVAPGEVLILTFNILQTCPYLLKWRVERTAIAPAEAQNYLTLFEGTYQPYMISGTVKNYSTNLGIPYATVTVKDASNTVITTLSTDASGNYAASIAVPGDYYVVASQTGYDDFIPPPYPVEVNDANPNTMFNIFLDPVGETPLTPVILDLVTGWNFISFPRDPSPNNTITEVLKEVSSNVRIVWGYDNMAKMWLKYKQGTSGTLANMVSGLGYWIYMNAPGSITMTNWAASPLMITLRPGWNLVGYNGTNTADLTAALASISSNYLIVWNWLNDNWFGHRQDGQILPPPVSNLLGFYKKQAYWIKTNLAGGQTAVWNQY